MTKIDRVFDFVVCWPQGGSKTVPRGLLGGSWVALGPSWGGLGPPLGALEPSWDGLGRVLGRLEGVFGRRFGIILEFGSLIQFIDSIS